MPWDGTELRVGDLDADGHGRRPGRTLLGSTDRVGAAAGVGRRRRPSTRSATAAGSGTSTACGASGGEPAAAAPGRRRPRRRAVGARAALVRRPRRRPAADRPHLRHRHRRPCSTRPPASSTDLDLGDHTTVELGGRRGDAGAGRHRRAHGCRPGCAASTCADGDADRRPALGRRGARRRVPARGAADDFHRRRPGARCTPSSTRRTTPTSPRHRGDRPPFVAFVHGGPTAHVGAAAVAAHRLLHQPRHRRRRRQLRRLDRLRPRVPQPAARAVGRRRRRGHRRCRARPGRRRASPTATGSRSRAVRPAAGRCWPR